MKTAVTTSGLLQGAARSDPRMMWVGAIADPSGYTDELRGFLRALEHCGYQPALREQNWNLNVAAGLSPRDRETFDRQQRRDAPGAAVAIHQGLPAWWQPTVAGVPNVQRCMFETDAMPAAWLPPLRDRDEVWVPSEFNVESFARSGVDENRLRVLGGTLDFDLFDPDGVEPLELGAPEGHFTFLTNFDFSERKGWRQLLRAWARAFASTDPVCLVLKTGSLVDSDDEVRGRIDAFIRSEFRAGTGLAPIRVLCERLSTGQMPSLYAGADAYVLASRGEGWGRPYMEALAMGLPTIASNWSGNLAFMDRSTSWLVDGHVVPVEGQDLNHDLYAGHGWFEPDVDELAAALRDVVGDPTAARAKAAPARADLIRRFGPEAVSRRAAELARDAWDRWGEHRSRPEDVLVWGAPDDTLATAFEQRGWNVRRRMAGSGPWPSDAPTIVHGAAPPLKGISRGATIAALPAGAPLPTSEWIEEAVRRADRVWVADEERRSALVAGGMPPGVVEVVTGVDAAADSLAILAAEGLPLAREVRRAEIEARSRFALYAPDWTDEGAWGPPLDAWVDAFTGADDVTLALYVDGDADAIGARIMARLAGRDEATLPDLALVVPTSVDIVAVAASAHAVLLDGCTDTDRRPELLRRARRLVSASGSESPGALRRVMLDA